MMRFLMGGGVRTFETFLGHPAPQSLRLGNGFATLYWSEAVQLAEASVALVSESGRIALDASPTMGPDGKSATFVTGAITATALLAFAGKVTEAGAEVPFDFVRASSPAGAQKALTAADVPIFVHQAQDMTLSGDTVIFGNADNVIELKGGSHTVNAPVIRLGSGHNRCILGNKPGSSSDGAEVFRARSASVVDAGPGRNILVINTYWLSEFFGFSGKLSLDSYNFSHFGEVFFPYGTILNRPGIGSVLTLTRGTKNAFDTLTFGSKSAPEYNPDGDMAVVSGTATGVVINGMAEHSTINFNGGVSVPSTALTLRGVRKLDVNFTTQQAVDMTFGTLALSNAEDATFNVSANNVVNNVNIANMKVTSLRTLTLNDADTDDSASLTVNGTVASGSKADFSGFKGAVTLTDNVGFATVILADAHANTITLKADNAANVIEYKAVQGTGDTINNFEVATDSIRFPAALSGRVGFVTADNGDTSIILEVPGGSSGSSVIATLPGTNGFSASNIVFS